MANDSQMKLGKQEARSDPRTLRLGAYFTPQLPPPPPAKDWSKGITDWGMMRNDKLRCCTISAIGHAIQVWTANGDGEVTVSDGIIEQFYEKWDEYNPNDPTTDRGGVELDVLNDWRKSDFDGHELIAYMDPDPGVSVHIQQSIALFGGCYIGLRLPLTARTQTIWDAVPDPGDGSNKPNSWGGHAVFVCGYDENYLTCITWGQIKKLTWNFWKSYCDEAHTLLSQDWVNANMPNAAGVDLATLKADLDAITGG